MSGNNNIEEVLLRYFAGSATKNDIDYIHKWRESSEQNNQEFHQYEQTWRLWNSYSQLSKIDVDKALNKVGNNISTKKNRPLKKVYYLLAVILFPILVISNVFFITSRTNNQATLYKVSSSLGVRTKIVLPDSSIVWLNSGSTLNYPSEFDKNKREVELIGEGYFDVVKNEKSPFYIKLGEFYMKVLGTTFNVKMYSNDDKIETTLITGKICLIKKKGKKELQMAELKPDQHLIYNKKDKKLLIKKLSNNNKQSTTELSKIQPISAKEAKALNNKYSSWIGGKIIFRNDPMEEVASRLSRWYNADIQLVGEKIKNYSYTATFTDETLEQALKSLELSAPIEYKITNQIVDNPFNQKKRVVIYLRK